jgi:hypothetical protein
MPTATSTKSLTPTQQIAETTRQAAEALGLEDENVDEKVLAAALVVAALDAIQRSESFANHLRAVYERLRTSSRASRATPRAPAQRVAPDIDLIPMREMPDRPFVPGAAPDAYLLYDLYGVDQLPLALGRYTLRDLLLAAELVQQRHPGTKPKNKTKRESVIAYIVEHVTGGEVG